MKVLVACEFSAVVRDAFRLLGHWAVSADLRPTEGDPEFHVRDDVRELLRPPWRWDLLIAFPPCTDLAVSGARWWPDKARDGRQRRAAEFFMQLYDAPNSARVAVENPVGWMNSHWRKPDQIIQPWQFGHGETKATCLWLRGLPPLVPTKVVDGRHPRVWRMGESKARGRERSRTYLGIARAMAQQWGGPTT